MAKKISSELICAVAVVLAAAGGGTYFYLKGEEPVKVVVAAKNINAGPITPADVKQATLKRRDVPSWVKLSDSPDAKSPYQSVLVGDVSEVRGKTDNKIEAGFYIMHRNGPNAAQATQSQEFTGMQIGNGPAYSSDRPPGGIE